jgi:16S rRNA processing protein RimM
LPTEDPSREGAGDTPPRDEVSAGEPTRILVGLVAKAHGLQGEVVVDVLSDAPERFAPGSIVAGAAPESLHLRELQVAESRPFQGRLLVRFEGFTTREEADTVHGYELTIPRGDVAPLPEGRHYRFQLIGLSVRTPAGVPLGRVTDVFATGSNDVLVVEDDEREILIPMLEGVILTVDVPGGVVVVEPPPGLPGLPE